MARKAKAVAFNLVEDGDSLVGTQGADKFVLREGQGDKTVSGFEVGKDKILFDYNSYSDVFGFGPMYDGRTFTDFTGLTTVHVSATDINQDGITDTTFSVGEDSIMLLGIAPDQLFSGSLMGG